MRCEAGRSADGGSMENAPIPAKRALAVLDNPPADVDTSLPPKRISKKVRTAIGYMVNATRVQAVPDEGARPLRRPYFAPGENRPTNLSRSQSSMSCRPTSCLAASMAVASSG